MQFHGIFPAILAVAVLAPAAAAAQPPAVIDPSSQGVTATATAAPLVEPPDDYVVGPDDVLSVAFWREPEMSGDVVVRPDGRISLPLLHDVDVAGLTPDQVRARVTERARMYVGEPNATVVVRQINSRKVFITGGIERPGAFSLLKSTNVLQLIALAGGLKEFAKTGSIIVVRLEGDRQVVLHFNYDDIKNGKNMTQNIVLKPGDTVVVPQ